jgi:hypothetical protein
VAFSPRFCVKLFKAFDGRQDLVQKAQNYGNWCKIVVTGIQENYSENVGEIYSKCKIMFL